MYGYLVPCGGGQPLALSKTRFVLRSRKSGDQPAADAVTAAELTFSDGFWSVASSADGPTVRINDLVRDGGRLLPSDVLSIGSKRYRINYPLPESAETKPAKPVVPIVPPPAPRPVESPTLGALVPCGGGRMVSLRKMKVIVGRASDCDVVVPHRIVSSKHCELNWLQGHWQAVDLGSHNGTFVDGMRYHLKWVFPGHEIGFAKYRYRLEYKAQGAPPPARDDDVPVLSRRSLMSSVGLTDKRLESLPEEQDKPQRKRWQIDAE